MEITGTQTEGNSPKKFHFSKRWIMLSIILAAVGIAVFAAILVLPAGGVLLGGGSGDEANLHLVSDGTGGGIAVWDDFRSGTNRDVYARRLDASGNVLWASTGSIAALGPTNQAKPKVVASSGEAIIFYEDIRSVTQDIMAQKLDASGAIAWDSMGVTICSAASEQMNLSAVKNGTGGAVVVWQDFRTGSDYDIYAQDINASGTVSWLANGVTVCAAGDEQENPKIIPDGTGGFYVAWDDWRNGDGDVFMNRINSGGGAVFAADGIPVSVVNLSVQGTAELCSDLSGAIAAWQDNRGATTDIYVQKINGAGAALWTANGVQICNAAGTQWHHKIVSDEAGGAFIIWEDQRNGGANTDIYAQRINNSGTVAWTANGIVVCSASGNQEFPTIVPDGNGGFTAAWQDSRTGSGDIYAQRVNSAGSVLWTANGMRVSDSLNSETEPNIIRSALNEYITAWRDNRGANPDIYAQKITEENPSFVLPGNACISNDTFTSFLLDNAAEQVSYRFRAAHDMTAATIRIYTGTVTGVPAFDVGIQGDNNGKPSGAYIGGFASGGVLNLGWATFDIVNISLSAGTLYHVVIRANNLGGGSANFVYSSPAHNINPKRQTHDFGYESFTYDGAAWWPAFGTPVFAIEDIDGKNYGNVYDTPMTYSVYGTGGTQRFSGEEFPGPGAPLSINGAGFWVRKSGTPPDLNWCVYNLTDKVTVTAGVLTTAAACGTNFAWKTGFAATQTLQPGKIYRVFAYTNGGDGANYYQLLAGTNTLGTSFYNELTYGGTTHMVFSTTTGGATITTNVSRDIIFKLLIPNSCNLLPDNSFAGTGVQTSNGVAGSLTGGDAAQAIIPFGADKILAAGWSSNASGNTDMTLWRYDQSGNLDNGFGSPNGWAVYPNVSGADTAQAIVYDGGIDKIYVAGKLYSGITNADIALWRYNSNGTTDNTFYGGTFPVTTEGSGNFADIGNAAAVDSTGRIVVAGIKNNGTNDDMFVARYLNDGTLDSLNFNNPTGYVVSAGIAGGAGADRAYGMCLDGANNVYVIGFSTSATNSICLIIWKYLPNGTLDTGGFAAPNGYIKIDPMGTRQAYGYGISIRENKIYAAGYMGLSGAVDARVWRFNMDGTMDASFGGGTGYTTAPPQGTAFEFGYGLVLKGTQDIYLTGAISAPPGGLDYEMALWKFDSSGNPVNNFGPAGNFITYGTASNNYDEARSAFVYGADKLILSGSTYQGANTGDATFWKFTDSCLLSDATPTFTNTSTPAPSFTFTPTFTITQTPCANLDPAFAGGFVVKDMYSADDAGYDIKIDSAGRYVVAGEAYNGADFDFCVWRYNTDGSPDTTFNSPNGFVLYDGPSHLDDRATGLAMDKYGRITVCGVSANGTDLDALVVRFNSDGTPDNTFNASTGAWFFNGSYDDTAMSVKIDKSDRIVIGGMSQNSTTKSMAIWRLRADGVSDPEFSGGSTAFFTTGMGYQAGANDIGIDGNGDIIAVGELNEGADADMIIVKFLESGFQDLNFNLPSQYVRFNGPNMADDAALGVSFDRLGRILVTGYIVNAAGPATGHDMAAWRYNTDGTIDNSFNTPFGYAGVNGQMISGYDSGEEIFEDANHNVVIAGQQQNANGTDDMSVWRGLENGDADFTFAPQAWVMHDNAAGGSGNDMGRAMVIDNQNRIVIAGKSQSTAAGTDLVIWRLKDGCSVFNTPTATATPTAFPTACDCAGQLGQTGIGVSSGNISGFIHANRWSVPAWTNITMSGVEVYVSATVPGAKMRIAIYNGMGTAHDLKTQSEELEPVVGWNYFDVPDVVQNAGTTVLIAFNAQPGIEVAYDTGAVSNQSYLSNSAVPYMMFNSMLFSDSGGHPEIYSAYIDFCPADCSTPTYTPTALCGGLVYFGASAAGGASTWFDGKVELVRYDMPVSGNITHLEAEIAGSGGNMRMAIYSHDSGNNKPDILLAESGVLPVFSIGWVSFEIPDIAAAAGTYWLAMQADSTSVWVSYDTVASQSYSSTQAFGPFPATHPVGGTNNRQWKLRAYYCPENTPTNTPTITQTQIMAPPASGYIGNQSVRQNAYNALIDAPGKKASYRFSTAQAKTITEIRLSIAARVGTVPQYRFGIQGDDGLGRPDGVYLGSVDTIPGITGWIAVSGLNVPVSAVTPYHIVVENIAGATAADYVNFLLSGSPNHRLMPVDQHFDYAADSCFYNGSSWTVRNETPVFALVFSDASSYGNTFYGSAASEVKDVTGVGQVFRVAADVQVDRVGAWIFRMGGIPAADLLYKIVNITDSVVMASGTLYNAAVSTVALKWVDVNLPAAINLLAGKLYRLELTAPGTDASNRYACMTLSTGTGVTFYNDLNYDGIFSGLCSSSDTGATWSGSSLVNDMGFRFSYGIPPTPTLTVTITPSMTSTSTQTMTATVTNTPAPGADWVLATGNAQFGGRSATLLLPYSGKLFLIAGTDGAGKNDVWSSPDGISWVQETNAAFLTSSTYHTGVVYNNKMWVMTGVRGTYDDDVWSSVNGSLWTEETAAAGFPARAGSKCVVHEGKMWLLSGRDDASAYLKDVWYSTNGVDWTAATRNAQFPGRWQHEALVYNGKMYIIGGLDGASLRNDVWSSSDGITWTQETAAAAFSARRGLHGVTYDDGSGMKMWIYAGFAGSYTNDVWYSTNGSTWIQKTAAANFTARGFGGACVFNNSMWMVSGNTGTYPNDVWYSGPVVQPTATPYNTITSTQTLTHTLTATLTVTRTVTMTVTATVTQTITGTVTPTITRTNTPTSTATPTVTETICIILPLSFVDYPAAQPYVAVTQANGIASSTCGVVTLVEVAFQRQSDGNYWNFTLGLWTSAVPDWDAAVGTTNWTFTNMPVLSIGETYTVLCRAFDSFGNVEGPGLGNTFSIIAPSPTVTRTSTGTVTSTATFTATPTCQAPSFFGLDTAGRFIDERIVGYRVASRYILSGDAVVTSLSMHVPGTNGALIRMAIYNNSGVLPDALLAETAAQVSVSGWNTLDLTDITLAAGTYWIAVQVEDGAEISHDLGADGDEAYMGQVFGNFPGVFGALGTGNFKYSIRADICPLNGFTPTSTPVPSCAEYILGQSRASSQSGFRSPGSMFASKFVLASGGWTSSLGARTTNTGGNCRISIYDDAAGVPGNLIVQTASVPTSEEWVVAPITNTYLAAGTYWLAVQSQAQGVRYMTGIAGDGYFKAYAYGTFPASFGAGSSSTDRINIVAFMCPGSAPTPTPTFTQTVTRTVTQTITPTNTSTVTDTATQTITNTVTPTATSSITPTYTPTFTQTISCGQMLSFGKQQPGYIGDYLFSSEIMASKFNLAEDGTVDSLAVYILGVTTGRIKLALYTDNAGLPDALLTSSGQFTGLTGWNTADVADVHLTAGTYWIAVKAEYPFNTNLSYETGAAGSGHFAAQSFGSSFAATFPGGGTTDNKVYTLKALYCPDSGFTPTQVPTLTHTQTVNPLCNMSVIGNTNASPSDIWNSLADGTSLNSSKYVLAQAGTITGITIRLNATDGGHTRVAVYSHNVNKPQNLLVESYAQEIINGDNYFPLTPTALAAGTYWLAFQSVEGVDHYYDTGAANSEYYYNNLSLEFGPFPTTFPAGSSGTSRWVISADICSMATATFTSTLTLTPSLTGTSTATPTMTQTATITPTFTITALPNAGINWTLANCGSAFPATRGAGIVAFNNRLWVVGGNPLSSAIMSNEVWSSADGINWILETASAAFPGRYKGGLVVYNNEMWLIGGTDNSVFFNDVWHSADGVNWIQATAGAPFAARSDQAVFSYNNLLWIAGGKNGSTIFQDVWHSLDGVNWTMSTAGAAFGVRTGMAYAVFNNQMWVSGGAYSAALNYNDSYYSTDGIVWTFAGNTPFFKASHAGAVYGGKFWVSGGLDSGTHNDVWWTTDGASWNQATANAEFLPRYNFGFVDFNNQLWVISGQGDTASLGDVWYSPLSGTVTPVATCAAPTSTPTAPPASTWRINAGGPQYTDTLSNIWSYDQWYDTGIASTTINTITGTPDEFLYKSNRYTNTFTYTFSMLPGSYEVTLKFTEQAFSGAGQRVFDVYINGAVVLTNYDIFADAGGQNVAVDKVFNNISPVGGNITIQFGPASVNNAKVNAIQIIPAPSTPTYTPTPTATATFTASVTQTNTQTVTQTITQSVTATITHSVTPTVTETSPNTATMTFTPTSSATPSATTTPVCGAQGNQVIGTGVTNPLNNAMNASRFWLQSGEVTGIALYVSPTTAAGNLQLSIYTDNANAPDARLATSVDQIMTGGWNVLSLNYTIPSDGYYWLAFQHSANGPWFNYEVSGAPANSMMNLSGVTYGTWPGTWVGGTPATALWSLYVINCVQGTQTFTPTITLTFTPTQTPSPTGTPSFTQTNTPTETWTFTSTLTPTQSSTQTGTATETPTYTATATLTSTLTPTQSSTQTGTATETPTYTATATFTWTLTQTMSSTQTGTATQTPTFTQTASPTQSWTLTPTLTHTETWTLTSTLTPTLSWTQTGTATDTQTATPTFTPTPTGTDTFTVTFTPTSTATPTFTGTFTDTPTFTQTSTSTYTSTSTGTPTASYTATNTPTFTGTFTVTSTYTITQTQTITATFTSTPTPYENIALDRNYVKPGEGETVNMKVNAGAIGVEITAKMYNLTGEFVREIKYTTTAIGWNDIVWDVKNAAGRTVGQGLYFVHIKNGGQSVIRKIYVLK